MLTACAQVPSEVPGAGSGDEQLGSVAGGSTSSGEKGNEAAQRRAAEKRAAELWAADKKAAEKRAAKKRAAEKRAAAKEAAAKRAIAKEAAEKEAAAVALAEMERSSPSPLENGNEASMPYIQGERGQAPVLLALPPGTKAMTVPEPKAMDPATHKHSKRQIHVKVEKLRIGGKSLEMVKLPGGVFHMGSKGKVADEQPRHKVSLKPFLMGRYEVTQQQWQSVMGSNPSYFDGCADCPVDSVSWDEIQQFIEKLNRRTGRKFRLPSEAEWEYACRAGGGERYCGGSDATQVLWYSRNSDGRSQRVGYLTPNAFGLYDMSGNIYEWVADCWHSGYDGAPSDGRAWTDGACKRRVLRGGAWYYSPAYATATYRNANISSTRFIIYGFRLAHDG